MIQALRAAACSLIQVALSSRESKKEKALEMSRTIELFKERIE